MQASWGLDAPERAGEYGVQGADQFRELNGPSRSNAAPEQHDPDGIPSPGHEAAPSEFFLPFFGAAARERGSELPRPLGVGANFIFINRPTKISGVRAGTNGNGLNEVEFLDFEATAAVRTAVARFDAWILPMVNVYLLAGYIWNTSFGTTDLRVYTGAAYWDTKRTIEGSIPVGGTIIDTVEFAVDQEPVDPVTVFVGTSVTLNDWLWLLLEVGGWRGTESLTTGLTVRF